MAGIGFELRKLLRKETLERAATPGLLTDGRRTVYGLGWMTANYRGLREVGHGGDITGFNTYFARYPDAGLSVIVLSNVGMRPPGPLRPQRRGLGGRLSSSQSCSSWSPSSRPPDVADVQFRGRPTVK